MGEPRRSLATYSSLKDAFAFRRLFTRAIGRACLPGSSIIYLSDAHKWVRDVIWRRQATVRNYPQICREKMHAVRPSSSSSPNAKQVAHMQRGQSGNKKDNCLCFLNYLASRLETQEELQLHHNHEIILFWLMLLFAQFKTHNW
jgi:hypothetical protein